MKHKKQLFMILIIVFLLVGLGTLAASEVTKNDTSTTKNADKNTKISTENNIKDTTKTQPTQEKQIQKTQKLNKKQDSPINVNNYNDLERELGSGSGTKILNINENITLGGNPTLSGSITNLIINGNQKTINGNGTQQFLTINSEQTVTINNLTITNCNASTGGAIYNDGGTLNINNSNLTQNNANLGGAILNRGNLTITNSNLQYNNADTENGGAIWNSGTLNITHSNLTHNTAEGVNAGYGGAIYNVDISSITDTNLQYNNANRGGAIHNGGTLNITHSNLTHNTAKENGGAIHINSKGILNICGSDINNNTAPNGGAIYNYASNVTIYESTLNNNQGSGCGGAIYDYTGPHWNTKIIMFNSNFTENKAVNGTVLYNHGGNGNYTITYNLFKNNTASSDKETLTLGPINDRGRTVEQNTYDNTDINLTKINLTTQKIKYHYDEDIILNYTVDLAIPEYYDADILDKINKTLYINGQKNITTKYENYTLSGLEHGEYEVYYTTCNQQSNTVTFKVIGDAEVNVTNYTQLVQAIENATREEYNIYKINLQPGDYNATTSINWENSATKKIIINGNNNTLNGQNTYQFIKINSGHNLTLENITITNYTSGDGGSIYNQGILTITDATFTNNQANRYGGAIYNNYGTLTVTDSTFTNNQANANGGAISNYGGTININKSTLENNTANQRGGAIHNNQGNLNVYYSRFKANNGSWYGGVISDWTSIYIDRKVTLFNSNFTENTAGNGAVIYNNGNQGQYNITHNRFQNNTADDKETLNLGLKNKPRIVEHNTYDTTDISLKTINLTIKDERTSYMYGEEIILNYTIELENSDNYDEDLPEKLEDITIYINGEKNITTKYENYTLSGLEPGEYEVYYTTCNQQSNTVTFKVICDSQITTPEDSYEYYEGINNKIPLLITDASGQKGNITITVKDQDEYKLLSAYYNIGNNYQLPTELLASTLKNLYNPLSDSYTINLTYSSDYANPSSTEFTLNITKQRNTTITYDILNNTEKNVQINITVQDAVYKTPIADATIQITGDINTDTTSGILTDNTLTPGDYTINVKYPETEDYKASQTTIDFTVGIDKDKKIAELEEQVENLTEKLDEAQDNIENLTNQLEQAKEEIETLNNNITNLTTQLEDAENKISTLNNSIEDITQQLEQARQEIETLNNTNNNLTTQLNDTTQQLETAKDQINNLTQQLDETQQTIETLNNTIKELTKPPLNTTITINPIKSSIGSITKITANIQDENGEKVTGGKAIFKINGITLKDENSNTIYAQVKDGIASINYKVQNTWIKNTTYIEAVYSGTENYTSSRTKQNGILNITKGKATITLDPTATTAKAGQTITLRAKVLDANGDRINNDKVIFKLNGITLKDQKGNTLYAQVIDGEAILNYTIPATYSAKTYTLTAVIGGNYYQRTETNGTLTLEKKAALITPDSISTKNKKTTVKATITDETGQPLATTTKLAFKVNGKTINNANSKNGKIDLSFTTTLRPGLYELLIISGENGVYKTGKVTTVLKI